MRLLGIVHAYNEDGCVGFACRQLLESGHDLFTFDHGSTDDTGDQMQTFAGTKRHRHIDRTRVSFAQLFPLIARFILERADAYDWVTWLDADELLRDPAGRLLSSTQQIEAEAMFGTDVIQPLLREFWITDADDTDESDHTKRLRHYRVRPEVNCPRGWRPELTAPPAKILRGRHRPPREWPKGTRLSHREWSLDHYPVRTIEQGRRKIMSERRDLRVVPAGAPNPYTDGRAPTGDRRGMGYHYDDFVVADCSNLVKNHCELDLAEEV